MNLVTTFNQDDGGVGYTTVRYDNAQIETLKVEDRTFIIFSLFNDGDERCVVTCIDVNGPLNLYDDGDGSDWARTAAFGDRIFLDFASVEKLEKRYSCAFTVERYDEGYYRTIIENIKEWFFEEEEE